MQKTIKTGCILVAVWSEIKSDKLGFRHHQLNANRNLEISPTDASLYEVPKHKVARQRGHTLASLAIAYGDMYSHCNASGGYTRY